MGVASRERFRCTGDFPIVQAFWSTILIISRSQLCYNIYAELCKNLKHMGYFTHAIIIILICVRFTVMREISFRGRVSVRVGRNAWVSREMYAWVSREMCETW